MNNEHRYIYFPLCLLGDIHLNPKKAINDILDYGIVKFSEQFDYRSKIAFEDSISELHDVYSQVIYSFYNKQLSFNIGEWIEELIENEEFFPDYESRGFSGSGEFEPYDEIDYLVEAGKENEEMKDVCIRFYQMHLAMKNLNLRGSLDTIWKNYQKVLTRVQRFEKVYGTDALVSTKKELIMDFYSNDKSNSDYELISAFWAIKSILGKKKFVGTNKLFIATRMIGAKTTKVKVREQSERFLRSRTENETLNRIFAKYTKRYHIDKLLDTLLSRGFLKSKIGLKGTRMLYLSTCMTHKELAIELSKKPTPKQKVLINKVKEKEAIQLLQELRSQF